MRDDLRTAYWMKERAELLLSNLKKEKAEGTITKTEYETLKPEYVAMLNDALPLIASIKAKLKEELVGKEKELERLEKQLSLLRARHKVGEITSKTYREKSKPVEDKVKSLQSQISELEALISCSSSADIGGPKDISMPKAVAQAKWKLYLKHSMVAVSGLCSRLNKRAKVSKPILFVIITVILAVLLAGLVVGTIMSHSAKIAFLFYGDYDHYGIRVIDADGTNERILADEPSLAVNPPVWSPKGTKIACYYYKVYDPLSEEVSLLCDHGVVIMNRNGKIQKVVVFEEQANF